MISNNPMLVIRTPPDKCTVTNRRIHKRTNRVIDLPFEPYDKIRPNRSVNCCKIATFEVVIVPKLVLLTSRSSPLSIISLVDCCDITITKVLIESQSGHPHVTILS